MRSRSDGRLRRPTCRVDRDPLGRLRSFTACMPQLPDRLFRCQTAAGEAHAEVSRSILATPVSVVVRLQDAHEHLALSGVALAVPVLLDRLPCPELLGGRWDRRQCLKLTEPPNKLSVPGFVVGDVKVQIPDVLFNLGYFILVAMAGHDLRDRALVGPVALEQPHL